MTVDETIGYQLCANLCKPPSNIADPVRPQSLPNRLDQLSYRPRRRRTAWAHRAGGGTLAEGLADLGDADGEPGGDLL